VRELHLGGVEEKPAELLLALGLSIAVVLTPPTRSVCFSWVCRRRELGKLEYVGGGRERRVMVVQDAKISRSRLCGQRTGRGRIGGGERGMWSTMSSGLS